MPHHCGQPLWRIIYDSTIEKELLAVVFGLKTFRPYLLGRHFALNTDHAPLVWLFGMNNPTSRLTKFRLELEQFHFTVVHIPGKDNVVADGLSRITSKDLQGYWLLVKGIRQCEININPMRCTRFINWPRRFCDQHEIERKMEYKQYKLYQDYAYGEKTPSYLEDRPEIWAERAAERRCMYAH